jgi:hypothetical protein
VPIQTDWKMSGGKLEPREQNRYRRLNAEGDESQGGGFTQGESHKGVEVLTKKGRDASRKYVQNEGRRMMKSIKMTETGATAVFGI